ncbi:MAG: hypothetical protein AAF126_10210 [Chloroflexota bacterium]
MAKSTRKQRLANTNPFAMPGEETSSSPSLADLTNAMLPGAAEQAQIDELLDENEQLREQLESALVVQENGVQRFQRFTLTSTALVVPADVTDEEKNLLGDLLSQTTDSIQFWIGDWANLYIQDTQTDDERNAVYSQLAEDFQMERNTLRDYAWVCRAIDPSLRKDALRFSHYKEVAGLPESLVGYEADILNAAVDQQMSVRALREHIRFLANDANASKKAKIVDDGWSFSRERVPNLRSTKLQKWFMQAKNGDDDAREKVLSELSSVEQWLEEIRGQL